MDPGELLKEALLGIRAHSGKFIVSGIACVLLFSVLGWIEANAVAQLAAVQQADSLRGADVLVVTPDRGAMPSGACERLDTVGGVIAVGGLSLAGVESPEKAPRNPYQLAVASGAYLSIVDPHLESRGSLYAGDNAALTLGVTAGSMLSFPGRRAALAGVVDTSFRAPEQSRWVYQHADWPSRIDQCWVEAARGLGPTVAAALPALMASGGSLNVDALYARTYDMRLDEWKGRASNWYWVVASLVCLTPLILNARSRRRELALYRIAGATRSNTFTLAALEATMCVSGATVLSLAVLWSVMMLSGTVWLESAMFYGVRAITLTTAAVLSGGYLLAYQTSNANLSASMRDRG
ncbi:FtsX-like permease family protein [Microbacterium aurum]|jgi:hypothetical protein|uniref:FtsX-like permease family protein n=1 Tax=Microbacterium aurum TaxID=36805 RepID=UPI00248D614F|nr:FtsX-like permease family protein [Microbacterium aurum]MBZ6371196.1 hypothetical protein [Microbacterium hominis]